MPCSLLPQAVAGNSQFFQLFPTTRNEKSQAVYGYLRRGEREQAALPDLGQRECLTISRRVSPCYRRQQRRRLW